ncbi:50S ribosomal protein L30e, partial [Candidatus Bathyarchaeota archaeon]|nr:50S ribosomal protein L30e [Candidatus Bathyarchaeota archaeon]
RLASNCPANLREDIEHYCRLSKVPVITFKGSSLDLAAVCGKPFAISALSIREAGDSEILKLTEPEEPTEDEESAGGNE